MPALRAIGGAVAARPWIWLGVTAGFLVLYHLAQLGAMLARFAVLGVGTSTALAMQPLGPLMAVAGMVPLAAALLYQSHRIAGARAGAAAPGTRSTP